MKIDREAGQAGFGRAGPQHEGEKADENVSLNPALVLMPDRTDGGLIFLDTKGGLAFQSC